MQCARASTGSIPGLKRSFSSPLESQSKDAGWSPTSSATTVRVSSSRASNRSEGAELSQSISVVCRVRPISEKEQREQSDVGVRVGNTGVGVDVGTGHELLHFEYDAVLGPSGSQEEVYKMAAKPVVDDFLEGFNGTVFAYGQTGSGKTHTMTGVLGDAKHRGILPRVVKQIFDHKESIGENSETMLQVQFLEIYNEKIRDLLAPSREDLKVREDRRQGIYVEGATSHFVMTERQVHDLLQSGNNARAVGETQMNLQSSRSHSICIITLEQTNAVDDTKKRSKLFMVDLAGSEMVKHTGSEGLTLREAQHINKSLSALSNVITSLSERHASHIPYRNSKLTRMLQEAIGGNCRTALIICCSPAKNNEAETVSTMRFGRSAKKIKNKARVNKESSDKELALQLDDMKRKNRELKERLETKEFEIKTLQAAGGKKGGRRDSFEEIGPEAAKRIVEAKEEVLRAKERADRAEQEKAAIEKQLDETAGGYEDQMDEMHAEIESLQYQLKQKDRCLFRGSSSLRNSASSSALTSPSLSSSSAAVSHTGVQKCLGQLQQLELQTTTAMSESGGCRDDRAFARLVDSVKVLSETMKEHLQPFLSRAASDPSGRGGGGEGAETLQPLEPELQEELIARYNYMRYWRQRQAKDSKETKKKDTLAPGEIVGGGGLGLGPKKKVGAPAGVLKKRATVGSPILQEERERAQTPGQVRPWSNEKQGPIPEEQGARDNLKAEYCGQLGPAVAEGAETPYGRRKGRKKPTSPGGRLWGLGGDLLVTYH